MPGETIARRSSPGFENAGTQACTKGRIAGTFHGVPVRFLTGLMLRLAMGMFGVAE